MLVPAAGIVVCHEIDEVDDFGDAAEGEVLVVGLACGSGDAQLEVWPLAHRGKRIGVCVHGGADFLQEEDVLLALLGVLRVFPVDVDAVEAHVLDQLDAAVGEGFASLGRGCWAVEMLGLMRISPPSNGKHNLEIPVSPLEQIELLEAAVQIGADIVPGVAAVGPVDFSVGPRVPSGNACGHRLPVYVRDTRSYIKIQLKCILTQLTKLATDLYPSPPPIVGFDIIGCEECGDVIKVFVPLLLSEPQGQRLDFKIVRCCFQTTIEDKNEVFNSNEWHMTKTDVAIKIAVVLGIVPECGASMWRSRGDDVDQVGGASRWKGMAAEPAASARVNEDV
jgi:hypothetical protein